MSKPLVFVLQLIALGMIVSGFAAEPTNYALVIGGIALAIIGGIGIRERYKKG